MPSVVLIEGITLQLTRSSDVIVAERVIAINLLLRLPRPTRPMRIPYVSVLLTATTLALLPAQAVVVLDSTHAQHGYALAEELAAQPQFAALFHLDEDGTASATWIGNDTHHGYLLTAAHNFCDGSMATSYVYRAVNGSAYRGVSAVSYPIYRCRPEGKEREDIDGVDLAIVKLDRPVEGLGNAPALYAGSAELGKHLVFGGYGKRGTGSTGESESGNGRPAMATGVIENLIAGKGEDENYFEVALPKEDGSIENPFEGGNLTRPIDGYAGLIAEGDSGGGAFIKLGGNWVLAGVNSSGDGDTKYGDASTFVRVSGRADWLAKNAPTARFIGE